MVKFDTKQYGNDEIYLGIFQFTSKYIVYDSWKYIKLF